MSTGTITRYFDPATDTFSSGKQLYHPDGTPINQLNAHEQHPAAAAPGAPAAPLPPAVNQMAIDQANRDLAGMPGMQDINRAAVSAADPFAAQRGQYQNALQQLMTGQFTPSDPSYQARFQGGQQALERSQAAKGFLGSGNIMQELQNYGQGMASQEFEKQYQRLLPLTGATTGSPSAAGALQGQLYDWRNNALASLGGGMAGLAAYQPSAPVSNQILSSSFNQQPIGSTGQRIGTYQGLPLYQGHS